MGDVKPLLEPRKRALVASERTLPGIRARSIAARAHTPDLRDDMEGAGREGLCWAAHGFSAAAGIPFRPYAQTIVDRAIFRFLRKELRHRKLAVAGYVIAAGAFSELSARSIDLPDAMNDDEQSCIEKLHRYIDPKVMAGALSLALQGTRDGEDPADRAFSAQALAVVRAELSECDEADRTLFSAIYGEGKSTEEVATELGMAAPTVRSRHFRLLRALRRAIDSRSSEQGAR